MGILDVPGYSRAEANARFASFDRAKAATLLAQIGGLKDPVPAVSGDVPTVAHNTTTALSGSLRVVSAQDEQLTKLGHPGVWNAAMVRMDVSGSAHALGFFVDAADFEIQWFNGTAANKYWIWVDGEPITAAPVSPPFTANTTYYTRITFGSAKRRRVEFWTQSNDSWVSVRVPVAALVQPLPVVPSIAFVGDSFFDGDDATYTPKQLTMACIAGRALGVNFYVYAVGGTGYVAGSNNFGGAARRALIAGTPNLQLIVVSGSVNDDGLNPGTAAAQAFSDYATDNPGVPVIVVGPQPSSSTATISAGRQSSIAQVKAAADAATNVIAFLDIVGTAAGVPSAWSSGTTYNTGDLVTYLGSVWRASNGSASFSGAGSTPGSHPRWVLLTALYTGTGRVGTTIGDGTRDVYLYSDAVHPITAGSYALGVWLAGAILTALGDYSTRA